MTLLLRAPAKVNLVLRVGPRRADGYHDLASLMVPLDLADRIRVTVGRGRGVVCRVPGVRELDGPENLAARAALLFQRCFGLEGRVAIEIEKRIPVTAGLGGGSSDAAAVLRALARGRVGRSPEERDALAATALAVGSDVPFFLGGGPAWARGRGEVLTPAEVPPLHLVLLHSPDPSLAIRAKDAYAWLDAARDRAGIAARAPRVGRRPFTSEIARALARNDLQGPCFAHHPSLESLAGLLMDAGARTAIMSGSGPTVFGIFPDGRSARGAAGRVRARLGSEDHPAAVLVTRTLTRMPGVSRWTSPRSASFPSPRRSSRPM